MGDKGRVGVCQEEKGRGIQCALISLCDSTDAQTSYVKLQITPEEELKEGQFPLQITPEEELKEVH